MPIISHSRETPPGAGCDLAVVGGGAAGLTAAIFAARRARERAAAGFRVVVLDGARSLGAKILVSGGSRCNVTNAQVEAADFWQAGSPFVRQVLRAFSVRETVAFFEGIGVILKEEPLGKLFPVTNKARTVLEALLGESRRLGIEIRTSTRVTGLVREDASWKIETASGVLRAERIVLSTGGLSLPKTGSDGLGYAFAREFGHTLVPPVPALEPLILAGDFHSPLSGIAHEAAIRIFRPAGKTVAIGGSLLWTHFGISGPLALNASRFWRRACVEQGGAEFTLSFIPGLTEKTVDERLLAAARKRPNQNASTEIARSFALTQAVAVRLVVHLCGLEVPLGKLTREQRRALVKGLTAFPLQISGGRGYNFAEVTSGGVSLGEVNPKTMESRLVPGLYFAGEILDVDGRIGGFNFQWAWSTGRVAGRAAADPD